MDQFWNGLALNQANPPTDMAPPQVSPNGAIYFPYLQTVDQITLQPMISPPSGYVAGIYAQEDAAVSVGKAPAGLETTLLGTTGVVPWGRMTDMQQGVLNKNDGVNCLREFPGLGPPVVWGARTLVASNPAFQQWRYVPVRRTALFLEQSLYQSLGWVVFQPNDTPLWNAITQEIEAFMLSLFRQGSYFQHAGPGVPGAVRQHDHDAHRSAERRGQHPRRFRAAETRRVRRAPDHPASGPDPDLRNRP
jgi:uncharacterized protein